MQEPSLEIPVVNDPLADALKDVYDVVKLILRVKTQQVIIQDPPLTDQTIDEAIDSDDTVEETVSPSDDITILLQNSQGSERLHTIETSESGNGTQEELSKEGLHFESGTHNGHLMENKLVINGGYENNKEAIDGREEEDHDNDEDDGEGDELPLRKWRVEICLLDKEGNEIEASILKSCTYYLHPTFANPVRKISSPPFTLDEQGWGEFEFKIICNLIEQAGKFIVFHDLQFSEEAYAMDYSIYISCNTPLIRSFLESHHLLPDTSIENVDELIHKEIYKAHSKWIKEVPYYDEDLVDEITQMIINHPSVMTEINKYPRKEAFVMGFYQLPLDLLNSIRAHINKEHDVKQDVECSDGA
ncbi:uncharacterized protein NDAI_0E01490 [Naumovozyma dairenensis CBS 421]|uniref:YEATS domain-containing protein n=1 Tax=Naumovozyma dairenensis (strain ATCC 10597 / BCRC 20456 / CBS 421 / NBRC 0211 / NRRL Y-12639) TaxID=1071378 RepID=G0WB45_NAUDC|nr:hypothetical protein NDAI_0E01490 [Naumovozyma dairenensis CBS 421]CCD24965.1 hypothetical protein NDAI_0E01490 [Naumovozyma dairenensis CBS 421]